MTEGVEEAQERYINPPSYLNWARTLAHLLEDRDGVELFKKYVEEEAPTFNDHLNFFFACEGLKQQRDGDKIKQIIQAIYRYSIFHLLFCLPIDSDFMIDSWSIS